MAALVGEKGSVTGIDMTAEQLKVARGVHPALSPARGAIRGATARARCDTRARPAAGQRTTRSSAPRRWATSSRTSSLWRATSSASPTRGSPQSRSTSSSGTRPLRAAPRRAAPRRAAAGGRGALSEGARAGSNCVVNLSPDKPRVLQEVYQALVPGGEFYFSDVYCDRRLPLEVQKHEVLWGECIAGALYTNDFIRYARAAGFASARAPRARRARAARGRGLRARGGRTAGSTTRGCWRRRPSPSRTLSSRRSRPRPAPRAPRPAPRAPRPAPRAPRPAPRAPRPAPRAPRPAPRAPRPAPRAPRPAPRAPRPAPAPRAPRPAPRAPRPAPRAPRPAPRAPRPAPRAPRGPTRGARGADLRGGQVLLDHVPAIQAPGAARVAVRGLRAGGSVQGNGDGRGERLPPRRWVCACPPSAPRAPARPRSSRARAPRGRHLFEKNKLALVCGNSAAMLGEVAPPLPTVAPTHVPTVHSLWATPPPCSARSPGARRPAPRPASAERAAGAARRAASPGSPSTLRSSGCLRLPPQRPQRPQRPRRAGRDSVRGAGSDRAVHYGEFPCHGPPAPLGGGDPPAGGACC